MFAATMPEAAERPLSACVRKQPAVAADLKCRAGVRENAPKQNLIRCEHRTADRSLQVFDRCRRSEAVPSDEDSLRLVSHMSRRPSADGRRFDPIRLLREFGRRRRDNVEALATEIGAAELVELVELGSERR